MLEKWKDKERVREREKNDEERIEVGEKLRDKEREETARKRGR